MFSFEGRDLGNARNERLISHASEGLKELTGQTVYQDHGERFPD